MKKIIAIALTLVLTAALLAGCRNRTQPMETVTPTTTPTVAPEPRPTTAPTTEATRPSTEATETQETVDRGNGPLDGMQNTDPTGNTNSGDETVEGRSVRPMPKN